MRRTRTLDKAPARMSSGYSVAIRNCFCWAMITPNLVIATFDNTAGSTVGLGAGRVTSLGDASLGAVPRANCRPRIHRASVHYCVSTIRRRSI